MLNSTCADGSTQELGVSNKPAPKMTTYDNHAFRYVQSCPTQSFLGMEKEVTKQFERKGEGGRKKQNKIDLQVQKGYLEVTLVDRSPYGVSHTWVMNYNV